jgi:hypothetical protein
MPAEKMHADEVDTDVSLVRRLLAAQFRTRQTFRSRRSSPPGRTTPSIGSTLLPVAILVPLGRGEPAEGYPWSWSVYRWLKGENPTIAEILADQCKT